MPWRNDLAEAINKLRQLDISEIAEDDRECLLCTEKYNTYSKIPVQLPCPSATHIYCLPCISKWVTDQGNNSCPECRRKVQGPPAPRGTLGQRYYLPFPDLDFELLDRFAETGTDVEVDFFPNDDLDRGSARAIQHDRASRVLGGIQELITDMSHNAATVVWRDGIAGFPREPLVDYMEASIRYIMEIVVALERSNCHLRIFKDKLGSLLNDTINKITDMEQGSIKALVFYYEEDGVEHIIWLEALVPVLRSYNYRMLYNLKAYWKLDSSVSEL